MTETFASAMEGLRATNASVADRELVEALTRHGTEEGRILTEYQSFAETAPSPAARYLVNLILDDERRHHRILEEMANAIAWGWNEQSPEPAVPGLHRAKAIGPELQQMSRRLLAEEKRDHAELKRLRRQLDAYADSTLWALLVDMLLLDTEKHTRILKFLTQHDG